MGPFKYINTPHKYKNNDKKLTRAGGWIFAGQASEWGTPGASGVCWSISGANGAIQLSYTLIVLYSYANMSRLRQHVAQSKCHPREKF